MTYQRRHAHSLEGMMSTMNEVPTRTESSVDMGVLVLTLLLLPAGLILALVAGQKCRKEGRSQQPVWVGFGIGAVAAVVVSLFLL